MNYYIYNNSLVATLWLSSKIRFCHTCAKLCHSKLQEWAYNMETATTVKVQSCCTAANCRTAWREQDGHVWDWIKPTVSSAAQALPLFPSSPPFKCRYRSFSLSLGLSSTHSLCRTSQHIWAVNTCPPRDPLQPTVPCPGLSQVQSENKILRVGFGFLSL